MKLKCFGFFFFFCQHETFFPRLTDVCRVVKVSPTNQSHRRSTYNCSRNYLEVNAGYYWSQCAGHGAVWLQTGVSMLPLFITKKCLEWPLTMEQWKKVVWSDESCFLLYHVDIQVWVHLAREEMTPGTMWLEAVWCVILCSAAKSWMALMWTITDHETVYQWIVPLLLSIGGLCKTAVIRNTAIFNAIVFLNPLN